MHVQTARDTREGARESLRDSRDRFRDEGDFADRDWDRDDRGSVRSEAREAFRDTAPMLGTLAERLRAMRFARGEIPRVMLWILRATAIGSTIAILARLWPRHGAPLE